MIWLEFLGSAIVIVVAATRLAEYGDVIALRTKLGGMFVGTLLLAGATSLPELLTAINAINQGEPNLTVGNIFGSIMFNMFLLALLDLIYHRLHILRRITMIHTLSASMGVFMTGLAVLCILAQVDLQIGWIGVDSLGLMGFYLLGTRILYGGDRPGASEQPSPEPQIPDDVPSLRRAGLGFGVATLVLVVITPLLVSSSVQIAEETGLTTGFVGVALVGIITSLPEVVTTVSAMRIRAYDLAAGNLFGSNLFNIFALGLTDVFYGDGRFLEAVSSDMTLAGIIGLLLITLALIGNLARNLTWGEARRRIIEVDAFLILVGYVLGMWLIYDRGLM